MRKYAYLLILEFFLSQGIVSGQDQNYHLVENSDIKLISDIYKNIKDSSSFIISPFIVSTINFNSWLKPIIKQYGFKKHQFNEKLSDTILINCNKYFEVIEPDSMIKYCNTPRDTLSLITDPLIVYIINKSGKSGICSFSKIIYSHNKEFALTEYFIYCGFLCGHGELILMRKSNEGWVKIKKLMTIIS